MQMFKEAIRIAIQNQQEQLYDWEYQIHKQLTDLYTKRDAIRAQILKGISSGNRL